MPIGKCPECEGDVHVEADAVKNDIIDCDECGFELEIVDLDPVQLDIVEEALDDEPYRIPSRHQYSSSSSSTHLGQHHGPLGLRAGASLNL